MKFDLFVPCLPSTKSSALAAPLIPIIKPPSILAFLVRCHNDCRQSKATPNECTLDLSLNSVYRNLTDSRPKTRVLEGLLLWPYLPRKVLSSPTFSGPVSKVANARGLSLFSSKGYGSIPLPKAISSSHWFYGNLFGCNGLTARQCFNRSVHARAIPQIDWEYHNGHSWPLATKISASPTHTMESPVIDTIFIHSSL